MDLVKTSLNRTHPSPSCHADKVFVGFLFVFQQCHLLHVAALMQPSTSSHLQEQGVSQNGPVCLV